MGPMDCGERACTLVRRDLSPCHRAWRSGALLLSAPLLGPQISWKASLQARRLRLARGTPPATHSRAAAVDGAAAAPGASRALLQTHARHVLARSRRRSGACASWRPRWPTWRLRWGPGRAHSGAPRTCLAGGRTPVPGRGRGQRPTRALDRARGHPVNPAHARPLPAGAASPGAGGGTERGAERGGARGDAGGQVGP